MKLSSKTHQMMYMALIAGMYQTINERTVLGQPYAPSTVLRIVKQGSPEFFGPSCRNHKRTNKVRSKAKHRLALTKIPK